MGGTVSLVHASVDDPVGVLELQRPERHNSLVPEILEDLIAAHREVVDRGARVAVLAAAGPTFSTGGDITGIREATDRIEYSGTLVGLLNQAILEMAYGPIPMVAAVHGIVTGGSLGLVLACDHVVVASTATIRSWYATVGFAPDGGWTAMLPEIIGRRRVASVLLTDATISADDAVAWGIADTLVPAVQVRGRALADAARIAAGVPGTMTAIRRLAPESRTAVAGRLEAERSAFLAQVDTPEATEGMDRFLRGESP